MYFGRGRVSSGAGCAKRPGGGAGGAVARVRVGFGGLRGVFARCAHSGGSVALQMRLSSESVGVFSGLRGRRRELSVAPGRTAGGGRRFFGLVGCPLGVLYNFFVQSPVRSLIAARPVRGAAEACVS